jgi:hypothetical protein
VTGLFDRVYGWIYGPFVVGLARIGLDLVRRPAAWQGVGENFIVIRLMTDRLQFSADLESHFFFCRADLGVVPVSISVPVADSSCVSGFGVRCLSAIDMDVCHSIREPIERLIIR